MTRDPCLCIRFGACKEDHSTYDPEELAAIMKYRTNQLIAAKKKHNLQVKKIVWCLISYRDSSRYDTLGKNCIHENDAIRIKNELEMNEKIFTVMPEYICY